MAFDVKKILEQLETGASVEAAVPVWQQESWADPEGFVSALAVAHAGKGAPLKSRTGQHYDFFHDLVVRHGNTDRAALRVYDRRSGWQVLTYRQLHEQSARRATEWARQGVKAGAKVCLVYSVGNELLVSLAAALGLGACISFLPAQGKRFLARRLAALEPDHIATEPHQALLLEGFEKQLLQSRGQATPAFTSHTYKPSEPVGLLFSPLVEPPVVPAVLLAEDAWRGAMVDGLLTLGLGAGEHLAAPGYHPLQHLLAFLLATLLRGATYLHFELADLEVNPSLLTEHPIRALGVTPALRDVMLRARTPLKNVSHWFRNPEEPLDWQSWRAWVKQCGLSEVPSSNVLVDPAAGGAVLVSPRRVRDVHTETPPAPGRRWALLDVNMSGQQAPGDLGVFALLPNEERPPPYVVLTRSYGVYHYGGPRSARREGRVYLSDEVAETVRGLSFVRGAVVVTAPTGGVAGHYRYVLLVFTGSQAEQRDPWSQEIRRLLELQLGAEHLPDRMEFMPLYARQVEGQVDEAWCHAQFLTGALHRKQSDPLFQALTQLRGRLLEKEERGV
ncbi:long-chain fatty acid--CoA ligase [Stigmatella sp. ncwal1]|uniref:Long-chain fatty acid--CoA ligase n=1 Tax=Stigmatella ashevillensis TaxID=2995309 RepID=A0ABT5DIT7_9BACT|nr:long-chain fatty acid--CoA ligase [Stigmatella ashevillena]MDC0713580.1 long-chain fatty acid--CoA ligase [Stigmatella ashevillena]